MKTQFNDLSFERLDDGVFRLGQSDGSKDGCLINIHPAQLRYIFEQTGYLLPPAPTDELSKRLARQLCELRSELVDEYGISPGVNEAITMLGAYCDSLPDVIFKIDLYHKEPSTAEKPFLRTAEQHSAFAASTNIAI